MQLRDVDFGYVFNASGARNLTGKGYWFHKVWLPLGLNYKGSTFVAKTTTLRENKGNMPLLPDGETPRDWIPKCVVVNYRKGIVLNAVGLSGPGARFLFDTGRFQQRTEPFILSFMSILKESAQARLDELREYVEMLGDYLPHFRAPVALQINFSCPNIGLDPSAIVQEATTALDIAARLGIPLIPKFNATVPVEPVVAISCHEACDAICMSNSIPWGQLPEQIDWQGLFGSTVSPLAHLGGGGLSGKPLLPIVTKWIDQATTDNLAKPVIGCGGILSGHNALTLINAGALGLELGSMSLLRPWRVQRTIRWTNWYYSGIYASLYGTRYSSCLASEDDEED